MAGNNIQIVEATPYAKQQRVHRKPKETFSLKYKPYEIVPFMFHPVLPGETLDSAFLQSRIVTDKVKSNLVGWWQEKHIFYVPLRALTDASFGMGIEEADFSQFFLTNTDAANMMSGVVASANDIPFFAFKGGANFLTPLMEYVVRTWFRDEDELSTSPYLENYATAQLDEMRESWANSLKLESTGEDDDELPGVDEQEELDILPGMATHYQQWEFMRDQGLTDATYRDYLKSYGITPPSDVPVDVPYFNNVPIVKAEKLRTIRKWSYPTLSPQPGEAESSSVLYWNQAERVTKTRFFGEPGFIIGVTLCKPKLYLGNLKGHISGLLDTTMSWLPATLAHLPYTSLKETLDSATDGPLQNLGEDYWMDVKDVFKYGGHFINHAIGAAANVIPMPAADLNKYPTEGMIDSIFATTDGTKSYCFEDGAVHLDILGKIRDTTPR